MDSTTASPPNISPNNFVATRLTQCQPVSLTPIPTTLPIPEIVAAYRSQWQVEADFRQMKDRSVVSFSPMFHWTDQRIRVHAFYCVLALAVARLMVREAAKAGLQMSVRELLSHLAGIEETILLYARERGRARHMLTDLDPTQSRLYDLFGLETYAPKR